MNGFLIVYKPQNWTSHDIVAKLRNTLGIKKIGHGGTLDPIAEGVLIVLIGEYTKKASEFLGLDKSYSITMEFGRLMTTGDSEGDVIEQLEMGNEKLTGLAKNNLEQVLEHFTGVIPQQVPWFSAIKVNGKKLYQYARGKTPEELSLLDKTITRPARDIEIYSAKLTWFEPGTDKAYPTAQVEIACSSGTYTRVFVEDLARSLGLPAHQTALVRLNIGEYALNDAIEEQYFSDSDYLKSKIQT